MTKDFVRTFPVGLTLKMTNVAELGSGTASTAKPGMILDPSGCGVRTA